MEKKRNNKIAFYVDYKDFNSKEAPPVLFLFLF